MNGKSDDVDGIGPATVGVGTTKPTSPLGPARAASRNTQTRTRHNEASQKPQTTDVRHRRHHAIQDTTRRLGALTGDIQRDH